MHDDIIKNTIEEFLKKAGIEYESIEIKESVGNNMKSFAIQSKQSGLLIGQEGATFSALNHIIKKIVNKKITLEEEVKFSIDVNDYQASLVKSLKEKAKILGERARSFGVPVEMEPMSSYERMIIHSFFAESREFKTESKGEGRERRIVIRHVPAQTNNL